MKRGMLGRILLLLLLQLLLLFACAKKYDGVDEPVAPTDAGPSIEGGPGDGSADAQGGSPRLYVFGGGRSPDGGATAVYSAPVVESGLGDFRTEPATLNSARVFAASTSVDGTLVSLGGVRPDGTLSDELETFPTGATNWSKRSAGFSGALYAIAAGNHRVFVFGGLTSDTPYDTRLHIGDFTAGVPVWSTIPFASLGRQRAAAAFQGDTLYVVGGSRLPVDGGVDYTLTNVGRFTGSSLDGGTLEPAPSLRKGRGDHQLVVLSQHLYALGGFDRDGVALASVEVAALGADGSPGMWASAADMLLALGDFCAVATADAIFVVGGFTKLDSSPVADVTVGRYVSGDLAWSKTTPLPVPLGGVGCAIR